MHTDHKYTNSLINETSPYLLTHAHNPVNWQAWNDKTLNDAQQQNKLMIVSIGYAACHWCHVMEHESFEDPEVAEIMNSGFIPVKVDREERPDVDQVYMNASMLINRSGGWPLNAITLPDGRPVFAGTYYPRENWIKLLNQITDIWEKAPEKLIEQAEAITEGINKSDIIHPVDGEQNFTNQDVEKIADEVLQNIDFEFGGTPGQPKFPLPVGYEFLLEYYFRTKNPRALNAVEITLKNMALGGIYDQAGGGFARYSVDKFWHAPHFEKMLYDNAQLVSLYSNAFQITKNKLYKDIVYETIEFVERELTSPQGGFYSALDADSEGVEGKFYVWTKKEIEKLIGKDAELINKYYNITETGNWEGNNILHPSFTPEEFAKQNNIDQKMFSDLLEKTKKTLLSERAKRVRPALDDKILTSWNALMLKGLTTAYKVFNEKSFLDKALKNALFIEKNLVKDDGKLDRNFKNNCSNINAYLDDYANLIEAFIDLYQVTFDEKWIYLAEKLTGYVNTHFLDKSNGMYFYTSDLDKELIAKKSEIIDNVIPGSNSVMAWNLFRLGKLSGKNELVNSAGQMLKNIFSSLVKGNFYYANWSRLLINFVNDFYEVVITGEDAEKFRVCLSENFLPNIIVAGGKNKATLDIVKNRFADKQTLYYACKNNTCKLPVETAKKLLREILPD
ncbi:MAG: thioredoxin domain-containing protein [Rhodothermaceae bacterium]